MRMTKLALACLGVAVWIGACAKQERANKPLVRTERGSQLDEGFRHPPASAKPHTWWHWMNGNITKEGITADLEAMKRVGVGGAQIFAVDCEVPAGPVKFMSPEYRQMIRHAISEADRLGIEICLHNCAGWSSSGGPWNTPEHAMQFVVTSETRATGPARFAQTLPQPPTRLGYYRDIAVLAFKTPKDEGAAWKDYAPKVTASQSSGDLASTVDGDAVTEVAFPLPTREKPLQVAVELARPIHARSVVITPGRTALDAAGVVQVSDDGKTYRDVGKFTSAGRVPRPQAVAMPGDGVDARFFRVVFTSSGNRIKELTIAEIEIVSRPIIDNLQAKAGYQPSAVESQDPAKSKNLPVIARDAMLDLSDKLSPDGKLTWDVPPGEWTVLRVGHTPTGKENHPAPPEGTGPENDKMSREALDAHWAGMMQPLIDDVGPLAGKSLNNALVDSYEVGGQNWTPKMRAEFKARRGYDMTRFLPVMTGRVVDSPEASERFLWDLRRTVADLIAENYYQYFAELCHKHGLNASIEPYTGPFEALQVGKPADIVMGEFWSRSKGHYSIKIASSVAHIYGKSIVGAESFTARPADGKWQNDPYAFKALGDLIYTQGINRYIFHRYAHQPWMNRYPGMTMGQWGFHFDRTNTWFEQSRPWIDYITRCQYLLQQGRSVADVAYFCGEGAPVNTVAGDPPTPKGYDWDAVNADVLMKAKVRDGRIVLPGGASYAVLVLPPKQTLARPQFLARLKELVDAGATVVGPRPERSPSLEGYPQSDERVKQLAEAMWGGGKVTDAKSLEPALAKLGPDFTFAGSSPRSNLVYIHRSLPDAEVYFVSNQRDAYETADCTFRINGKLPELWHADTGVIENAPVYRQENGRTVVRLQLEPSGSVFVVFRKPAGSAAHLLAGVAPSESAAAASRPAPKLQITKASYEAVDGAGGYDVTARLQRMIKDGLLRADVSNKTFGRDPAYLHNKQVAVEYTLDGKPGKVTVREGTELLLPPDEADWTEPAYELTNVSGKPELLASRAGSYAFTTASGKPVTVSAANVPTPVEITGGWDLKFPPNWGAPESVRLDKLISWTAHPDNGVKYFSGTATYTKQIDIPADLLTGSRTLYLDLGKVKNLAQVKLNGRDLGTLWKPPFRVPLAGVARPGQNSLEIRVTNLWPNRLIGDEQLPPDTEWTGLQLARMPQFVIDGKPSPTGRLTFTTWHHWTKDNPLLESGLLGPVTLRAAERVPLQP